MDVVVEPVTPDRWADLEQLFGANGAYAGCWCMWMRQTNAEFDELRYDGNRAALRALVENETVPGLLGYVDGTPVGWVSVGPREAFGRLRRSPITKPVDDLDVWSIVCFVVERRHQGEGVATALLTAAVDRARAAGAVAIEGYPVEPKTDRMPGIHAWMGLAGMFRHAGFSEVARRSPTRPFFRLMLHGEPDAG